MAQVIKPQFPPILPDGFHPVALGELRRLCVVKFPGSTTRRPIMDRFEQLLAEMSKIGFPGHVWVDGSFATMKIDPDDVDILIHVDSADYDGNLACQKAVDWASDEDRYLRAYPRTPAVRSATIAN